MNGITCVERWIDNIYCMCPMSYDSDVCEINVDDCVNNPCLINGSCVDGFNSYSYMCVLTWVVQGSQ